MKTYTISVLAKTFDLSRSTLLYYDRINLLSPAGRTPAGYRFYTAREVQRLTRICNYRSAGLTLDQIRELLNVPNSPSTEILENRLKEIDNQIRDLKAKQILLSRMIKGTAKEQEPQHIDKKMWVEMLEAAGMDDSAMETWHAEFERRAPEFHHRFLASLGIPEKEIRQIRSWAEKDSNRL